MGDEKPENLIKLSIFRMSNLHNSRDGGADFHTSSTCSKSVILIL